jgi:hypothetical protein
VETYARPPYENGGRYVQAETAKETFASNLPRLIAGWIGGSAELDLAAAGKVDLHARLAAPRSTRSCRARRLCLIELGHGVAHIAPHPRRPWGVGLDVAAQYIGSTEIPAAISAACTHPPEKSLHSINLRMALPMHQTRACTHQVRRNQTDQRGRSPGYPAGRMCMAESKLSRPVKCDFAELGSPIG